MMQQFWKTLAFPLNVKHWVVTWSRNSIPTYVPKIIENIYLYKIQIFTAALLTIAKSRNNPKIHELMNRKTKCDIPIQWNITRLSKNEVLTTWVNLENIMPCEGGQSKRPHIVWSYSYEMFRLGNSTDTESRLMVL